MLTLIEERAQYAAANKISELRAKIAKGELPDDGTDKVIEDLLTAFKGKAREALDLESRLSSAKRKARMGMTVF